MGDGVLWHLSKGAVHKKVDDLVNHKNAGGQFDRRAVFLDALINNANTTTEYLQIIRNQAGVTPAESDYLRDTWYNEGKTGYWPTLQPIYEKLRQGLIKAIQEAGTDRPLDSYWLPVAQDSFVAVVISRTPWQVTRVIVTPPPNLPIMLTRTHDAPMWTVKTGLDPKGVAYDEKTEFAESKLAKGVVIWRVRESYPQ